jgi:hypothetical protein
MESKTREVNYTSNSAIHQDEDQKKNAQSGLTSVVKNRD